MGSTVFDVAGQVIGTVVEMVKPGIDVALPFLKQAGEQALKIASPAIYEASKKAQEAIQGSGFDTEPVVTAAKVLALFSFSSSNILIIPKWLRCCCSCGFNIYCIVQKSL